MYVFYNGCTKLTCIVITFCIIEYTGLHRVISIFVISIFFEHKNHYKLSKQTSFPIGMYY